MIRGESGWDAWGGELSDPSEAFFLQRCWGGGWQKERHAEEGGLEILLSINCRDKGSTIIHDCPNLSH